MKRSLILSLALLLAASTAVPALSFTTTDDEQEVARRERRVSFPGFLGVELDEVSREAAQRLSLREERGALVNSVVSESSAAKAGLQKDDVIVKWNGERIESAMELYRHLRETPSGRTIRLGVIRAGREMDVDVTLGDRSDYLKQFQAEREKERAAREADRAKERAERDKQRAQERIEREKERAARMTERQREMSARAAERMSMVRYSGRSRLGVQLQSMSPQLAEYFGLSNRGGALVTFVQADSAAAKAGLRAGDVVISMGGEKVENPSDVSRALRSKSEGKVEIRVMRDRKEQTITVQLEKSESGAWLMDDAIELIAPVPAIAPIPGVTMASPKIAVTLPSVTIAPAPVTVPAFAPSPAVRLPQIVVPSPKITIPSAPVVIRPMPRFV